MDPDSGLAWRLAQKAEQREVGEKINAAEADFDQEDLAKQPDDVQAKLRELIGEEKDLVVVSEAAAQRARLGDRELRRRKQRRR